MSSFTLIGEPVGKERPRFNRKTGGIYTPKKSVNYENALAWSCKGVKRMEAGRPVKLTVDFYCTPKTRQQTTDLDNLLKSVLDGLVKGGVLADDVDVVAIEAYRWEDNNSRTELKLAYL